ncbi:tetratricopeptide repeat protein [Larsenimonas suaedae]|uniref:Tetratricopeptide repeat protein n=1 Tax=Larsenimonas suaedae TaxID=1851019 RepID=A0ABU1GUG4_9GAMM|nr:tetratricopeptide repeat protein [Larsenimonas suaedae]MCM2970970.1 tetratricopeptide repeat protein [Larsenimonas suaedae]MDR5895679.1 tetratricopeptide repeat protein [Larsenimonas suaedae]
MRARTLFFPIIAIGLGAALSGCAPLSTSREPADDTYASPRANALATLISGELSARRGDFTGGSKAYLTQNRHTPSAALLERATELASQSSDETLLLQSAELWSEAAPEKSTPWQILADLYSTQENWPAALDALIHLRESPTPPPEYALVDFIDYLIQRGAPPETLIPELSRHLGTHPDDHDARLALILANVRAERLDAAAAELMRAHGLGPVPEFWLISALYHQARGDTGRAEQAAREGVKRDASDARLWLALTQSALAQQDVATASTAAQRLVALRPDDTELHTALIDEAIRHRAIETGFKVVEARAARNERDQGITDVLTARLHIASDEPERALTALLAVPEGPLFLASRRQGIDVLLEHTNPHRAILLIQQQQQAHPDYWLDLVDIELDLLDRLSPFSAADRRLDELIEQMPEHRDELAYTKAMHALDHGRVQKALAELDALLERTPESPRVLNAYGYTLVTRTPHLARGTALLEQAHRLAPDHPAIQDSLGWAYIKAERYRDGILLLKRAYMDAPDDEIASHLIEALWLDHHRPQARRLLDDALQRFDETPALNDLLSRYPDLTL